MCVNEQIFKENYEELCAPYPVDILSCDLTSTSVNSSGPSVSK